MKLALLPFFGSIAVAAGDFSADFKKARESGNHPAMVEFLEERRTAEKENPDYYALASNYWWRFADGVAVSAAESPPGGLSLRNPETGEEAGSIRTNGDLDPSLRKKALDLTSEGFRKFPHRLDLGLGLAHVQLETGDSKAAVATLRAILGIAKERPGDLKWAADAELSSPVAVFLPEAIQGHTSDLLHEGTPESDALCKELCEKTIAVFPEHPFAYNVLAALADSRGDKEEVFRLLKIASVKAPDDCLILMNLGDAHRGRGEDAAALAAYRKVLELKPGGGIEEEAKEHVEALEGKAEPSSKD